MAQPSAFLAAETSMPSSDGTFAFCWDDQTDDQGLSGTFPLVAGDAHRKWSRGATLGFIFTTCGAFWLVAAVAAFTWH